MQGNQEKLVFPKKIHLPGSFTHVYGYLISMIHHKILTRSMKLFKEVLVSCFHYLEFMSDRCGTENYELLVTVSQLLEEFKEVLIKSICETDEQCFELFILPHFEILSLSHRS